MRRDPRWTDACCIALQELGGGPAHYDDVVQTIVDRGIRRRLGRHPSGSVNHALHQESRLPTGRVKKVKTATFALRVRNGMALGLSESIADEDGILVAAVRWRRNLVRWRTNTAGMLLGRKIGDSAVADFAQHVGVYVLHDGSKTVYAGLAAKGLFHDLKAHTDGRLAENWDAFSWISVHGLGSQNGESSLATSLRTAQLASEIVAVLLELPLNHADNRVRSAKYAQVVSAPIG